MTTEAGRAYVGLEYKTSDIGRLERDTQHAGSGFVSSWSGFAKKAAVAIGGAFAVKEVFSFAKDVTEEAAQTQKAVESIRAGFGASADGVLAFGESAAKNFGIAREASDQFSSAIAVAGRNIGLSTKQAADQAVGWQKLAGAVGQIKGQDPTSYFASLQRVMVGNARGLKQLGISFSTTEESQTALRLGIKGQSSDWTAAQKAQILYQIAIRHLPELLQQASKHSGDLVDTQRRLSAEWQNVKADIGDALLPAVTRLVSVLANALPTAFRVASEAAKILGAGVNALVGAAFRLLPIRQIASVIGAAFSSIVGAGQSLVTEFEQMRAGGASLGAALRFVAIDALQRLGVSFSTAKSVIGDFSTALGTVRDVAERIGSAIATATAPLISFVTNTDNLKSALSSTIGFVQKYRGVFEDVGAALGIVVGALVAYTAATTAWSAATAVATGIQLALDAAMAALPIIAVGIAIVALVAAVIYLYRHNETARQVILTAWHAIEGIVTGAVHTVTQVIRTFVAVGTALWHTFGGAITKIARTDFDVIVGVIRGVLKIVEGVIKVGLGIIHGNWSQAWSGIKEIARGAMQIVVSIIRGAISLASAAARAVGQAILHGIENAITGLAGFIRSKVGAIPGVVRSIAGAVASAAVAVGQAIIHGMVAGVTSLASSLAHSVTSAASGALDSAKGALGIGSPSRVFRDQVGKPIVQGIIQGLDQTGPGIATTLNRHLGKAIQVPLPRAAGAQVGGLDSIGGAQFQFDGVVMLDGKEVGRLVDVRITQAAKRTGRTIQSGRRR